MLTNLRMIWKQLCRRLTQILLALSVILIIYGTINNTQNAATLVDNRRYNRQVLPNVKYTEEDSETDNLHVCPILPDELGLVGLIPVNQTAPSWEELDAMYPEIDPGGSWRPRDCIARSRVALVIPYRDRDYNLRAFLQHMHPFLQKQNLQYTILVAEQAGNTTFNRGIMRNIGFQEANLNNEFDCTTFNDVDLLPENDMNSYGCPDQPRHMCIALDYFNYTPIASGAVFGGIVSFRNDHFHTVNGYSNLYFGWGGEDDDIMTRCRQTKVGYYRVRPHIGRYQGTPHKKDHRIKTTYKLWRGRVGRVTTDGLNTLQYKVLEREKRRLYTWVLTEVDEQKYQKEADEYLHQMDLKAKQDKAFRLANNITDNKVHNKHSIIKHKVKHREES